MVLLPTFSLSNLEYKEVLFLISTGQSKNFLA